jgi:hypothetical protein
MVPLFRLFITGFLAAGSPTNQRARVAPQSVELMHNVLQGRPCATPVSRVVLINASALATGEEAAMDVGR